MTTHCTHCGTALTPETRFCPGCGQPVSAPSAPPQAPYPAPPPPYGQPPLYGGAPGTIPGLSSLPPGARKAVPWVVAALVVLGLHSVFSHGGASAPGQSGSPTVQAGVFSGRCTTEAGVPLPNVDVKIEGTGQGSYPEAHTDANGIYSLSLPPGTYSVASATYPLTLGTTGYNLPLALADGTTNDAADIGPGIVRNMVLHIHGKISPQMPDGEAGSFYGGSITSYVGSPSRYMGPGFPDGSVMELTLVPEGPLADGTTGQTLVLRHAISAGQSSDIGFIDIPIGQYTASERLLGADGSVQMQFLVGAGQTAPDQYKQEFNGLTFLSNDTAAQVPPGHAAGVKDTPITIKDGS